MAPFRRILFLFKSFPKNRLYIFSFLFFFQMLENYFALALGNSKT
jgi:hypothetical protein